jgi:hypothetical protein
MTAWRGPWKSSTRSCRGSSRDDYSRTARHPGRFGSFSGERLQRYAGGNLREANRLAILVSDNTTDFYAMSDAWIDFYAALNPTRIVGTEDPMVTLDFYDLSQLKAAFEAGVMAALKTHGGSTNHTEKETA